MHIRIMAPLSKHVYGGLDLYTRVVVGNQAVSLYDAHDVVFSAWMPFAREVPYPPDWWRYPYRYHLGLFAIGS